MIQRKQNLTTEAQREHRENPLWVFCLIGVDPSNNDLVFLCASDETTSHSTKPASGQVAGYVSLW